ncbi:hypothetical protein B0A52_03568 [Exophiala mesophila]|uniref:Uncharacterized protein n=1 Tax=Exophiala mesophila TaxID=212818 RepID=A0A438N9W0_EXOME|nr:hypothetical protein B0A52_03568 [Exophiala mesophila]
MLFSLVRSIVAQRLGAFLKQLSSSWDRPTDRQGLVRAGPYEADITDPIGDIYDYLAVFQEHHRWHKCKAPDCSYAPDPVRGIMEVLGIISPSRLDEYIENFLVRIPENDMKRLVDDFRDYHEGISDILRTFGLPDKEKTKEENFKEVMDLAFSRRGQVIFWSPLPNIYQSLLKVLSAGKKSYLFDLTPGINLRDQGAFGVTSTGCKAMRGAIKSELNSFLAFLDVYGDIVLMLWDVSKKAVRRFIFLNPDVVNLVNGEPDSGRSQQPPRASARDSSVDSHERDSTQPPMYEPREDSRRD